MEKNSERNTKCEILIHVVIILWYANLIMSHATTTLQ